MKYLVLNGDFVISDEDEDWEMESFLRYALVKENGVTKDNVRFATLSKFANSPWIPDEAYTFLLDFVTNGGLYRPCTEYEFNTIWYFSEAIDEAMG